MEKHTDYGILTQTLKIIQNPQFLVFFYGNGLTIIRIKFSSKKLCRSPPKWS